MDIIKYLRKEGVDTVNSEFYRKIRVWKSWYEADVPGFHRYKIYNGRGCTVKMRRKSLGMGKTTCEDISNLLLNEKVTYTVSDDATYDYIKKVLDAAGWSVNGSKYQELKAAYGTVAYVPYADMEIGPDGAPIRGSVRLNYVTGDRIFPITWSNGKITECAFTFIHIIGGKEYVHVQLHRIGEDGTYYIENRVVKSETRGAVSGRELSPEEYHNLGPFRTLAPRIETGSTERQFVIDRLNICNNADPTDTENPMGIAIFANAIDILAALDNKYDSYDNEFGLGKKRIFVSPEMLTDSNGNPAFDPNDTVFYQLPEDYSEGMKEPIKTVDPTLRTQEHSQAINDDLNYLSEKCGFGKDHYRFEAGTVQTATAVISENSDLYRTVRKHEVILDSVLKELFRIIVRLGVQLGEPGLKEDADITVNFDDSIIEDTQAQRRQDMSEVAAGIMRREEYRAKWYGETEQQAKKRLPESEPEVME